MIVSRVLLLLGLAFLATGAPYVASGFSRAGASDDLALINARIYPSPSDPAIDSGSILIHDGRIVTVGRGATIRIPGDVPVVDCHGLIVTAGFWNSHVHILPPGLLQARTSATRELNEELDSMFNRWGFTTVFDLSSVLDNTLALRRRIDSNELRGPRLLTVGEPVWIMPPVYVLNVLAANHIDIPNTVTPEQAIALVRDHAGKGANGIKLFTGSYQGKGEVAGLPLPVAKAAVEEAHRRGMPVFAHPHDENGVSVAVDSGVDVLAHTVPQSPSWNAGFVSRLKNAKLALIPTLTLYDVEARKGNDSAPERDAWIARMVAQVRAYSNAGGDILFGTDIGYIDHYETNLEFTLMSQAGMSYQQILAALTTNPARKFGYADRIGRIAAGMDADLTVLGADPAQDVAAYSLVHYAIRNGKIIYARK